MNTASDNTRMLLHPFGALLLPIVPIICLLLPKSIGFALICIAVGFVVAFTRGPKFLLIAVGDAVGICTLMRVGLAISLPVPPDAPPFVFDWLPGQPSFTVTPAISGALGLAAVSVVYVATIAFLRTRVLADSVITQFGVPYRVVDVLGLGGRFAVLLRQDTNSARLLARLRCIARPNHSACGALPCARRRDRCPRVGARNRGLLVHRPLRRRRPVDFSPGLMSVGGGTKT